MDLAQLHKEYQKTAKNERREEAAHALQQQRQAIESLTNQNEVLKNELTIEDRQAKAGKPSPKKKKGGKKKGGKGAAPGGAMSASDQISRLQDQGDQYTRKIELERRRMEELDKNIKQLQEKILGQRQKMGGVNSSKESNQQIARHIQVLENRLDKALVKHNEAVAFNKKLRKGIDNLRRERVIFDGIYKKLERELHEKKREMARIIDESNKAYEAREKAQREMEKLKDMADKEQATFDTEWKELGKLIEADRKMKDYMKRSAAAVAPEADHRGQMTAEEEARLKKKVARGAWGIARDKAHIHLSQEKIQSYEEAFNRIQEATGIQDIDELVDKFIQAEDKNFSLFNYVNELNAEIEKLESQISNVKAEIEKYKGQGVNTDNQRKKILRDLENRLARTESKADDYEEKYHSAMKTINQLKVGVQTIFNRLGCNNSAISEMLGNQGVTEGNMMQYLGIIEQRTNEVLQMYAANQQHVGGAGAHGGGGGGGAGTGGAGVDGLGGMHQGPAAPAGKVQLSVHPPTFEEMSDDGLNSDDEDETRPMTRSELQQRTAKQMQKQHASDSRGGTGGGRRNRKSSYE